MASPAKKRELVAGGDIHWKPIDKTAALLLAKSSPIHHPPDSLSIMAKRSSSKICGKLPLKDHKASDDDLTIPLSRKLIQKSQNIMSDVDQFSTQVLEAKKILNDATDTLRRDVLQFTDEMPAALKKVRDWRMTMDREVNLSKKALEDLRKFFLGEDHEREMLRLNEFVRTCERLEALAQNGTLDKVAEIMLKLA